MSNSWTTYSRTLAAPVDADDTVDVVFTNDYADSTSDRNLFLDTITVGSQSIPAAHRALSYDTGPLDGEAVYASDGLMYAGGATRLTERYAYDTLGNLTTKADLALSYGANGNGTGAGPHQARSINGVPQSFDAAGNLTSGRGRTLGWNAEQRPTSISGSGILDEQYTYDADGARVKVVSSQGTTVYMQGVWEEVLGGASRRSYTLNGQTVAVRESSGGSSTLTYLHGDHLGSVSAVTNSGGGLLTWQEYDPWGAVRRAAFFPPHAPVTQTKRNYTGQLLDGTGLLFYNARYYDPAIGRFISADTIVPGSNPLTVWPSDVVASGVWSTSGSGPANPQELNRYAYALNNPVRYTDPTGHCVGPAILICGAAAGGLGELIVTALGGAAIITGAAAGGAAAGQISAAAEANPDAVGSVGGAEGLPTEPAVEPASTLQPGPYAGRSIPARGPGRDFTPQEREQIDEIGRTTGCHTCGTTDPGTRSGNFIPDHQPPNQLNPNNDPQRLYPHCRHCSQRQGGEVNAERHRQQRAQRSRME